MLESFRKYEKYKDYFRFSQLECKIALVSSIIIGYIAFKLNIYENYSIYIEALKDILIGIATGMLGMIGTILTGIALILSLIDDNFIKRIKDENKINKIITSFQFLVFNLGIGTVYYFILYFCLYIPYNIYSEIFYVIIILSIYFFVFLLFYTIGLIYNSIKIFFIKNIYSKVDKLDKRIVESANEIKIDLILSQIYSDDETNNFLKSLLEVIDKSEMENKEELLNYIKNYYGLN